MNDITIICCWNDEYKIKNFETSLGKQDISCDLIFLDNRKQRFKSCSEALNYGLQKVETKYVIFSHQDIYLNSNDTLSCFLSYLNKIKNNDILGVAGAFKEKNFVKTNIKIGDNEYYGSPYRVEKMEKCFSLDECWFGGYTERFKKRKFDETICDNWHLYAVDQSIYNLINNYNVYVCDVELLHHSTGDTNHMYNVGLKKLCKKYSGKIPAIYTPCCFKCHTNFISRNIYYLKNEIKLLIK